MIQIYGLQIQRMNKMLWGRYPGCLRVFAYLREMILACCLFLSLNLFSQQANVPLNYEWIQQSEADMVRGKGFQLSEYLMKYDSDTALIAFSGSSSDTSKLSFLSASFPLQTSMRPWIEQGHPLRKNIIDQNCGRDVYGNLWNDYGGKMAHWIRKYHNYNSLLQVQRKPENNEPGFHLYIDPFLDMTWMNVKGDTTPTWYVSGPDTLNRSIPFYLNSRGIVAHGDIGSKLSFETTFRENQAFVPGYMDDFVKYSKVFPGNGRWKLFKRNGYDFAMASGYLSWSPFRNFNMQVGTGKHFVGDGYRSLLLSDNAFNYPFARLTGWFGPNKMFQYTTIYASLMNLHSSSIPPSGTEALFQKKAASFYQLAAKIGRVGEVSLFQGLIWSAADSVNKQHMSFGYFNPLIFSSIPSYGMSNRNNFLVGGTWRIDLLRTIRLYGQIMIDDIGKDPGHHRSGMQVGVKYFNAFTVKRLHLNFEYNRVRPYSYAATDTAQSYTHYAQPLAHPYGANFSEMIFGIQYKFSDFFFQARYEMATLGTDTANSNYGQDPFKTDYFSFYPVGDGNYRIGQGAKTSLTYLDVKLGWMVSYASNLNICVGYTARNVENSATSDHLSYVYVALRTSLTNTYFDFYRN